MNDQSATEKAQETIESIINALGIIRVVYVDDAHKIEVADVIAAVASLDQAQLHNVFPEFGDTKPDDPDILSNRVRTIWNQIDSKTQLRRGQAILVAAKQQDGEDANDIAYASIVSDLVADTMLLNITPEQWESQREQLLQESQTQRTLFLFDRAFNGTDPEGGIKIIA